MPRQHTQSPDLHLERLEDGIYLAYQRHGSRSNSPAKTYLGKLTRPPLQRLAPWTFAGTDGSTWTAPTFDAVKVRLVALIAARRRPVAAPTRLKPRTARAARMRA